MIKFIIPLFLFISFNCFSQSIAKKPWKAKWINCRFNQSATNSWSVARQTVNIKNDFAKATVRIAVDSKYWLYINGQLAVFEGGLKRGPSAIDTYYDEVEVSKYLKKGENNIAIMHWYFGKDGFSHNSSGKAGLLFELYTDGALQLISDKNWFSLQHLSYLASSEGTQPNWRLSESNVVYDARKDNGEWYAADYKPATWSGTMELGAAGCGPWNNLVKRPIPQWKDFSLKNYSKAPVFPIIASGDTIKCELPYNAQITPFFKIKATAGLHIHILTDNYMGGGEANVRAEYITKNGVQEYEALGWMNGHEVYYVIPAGVEVLGLSYRETGYDTEFAGNFMCNDKQLNTLWQKSQRTLYITMRDSYMDCPDRERAQWSGDAVNEIGESFYALCPKSHLLAQKFYAEIMNWQRADSTIFSPIPAANWDNELPMQMLNTVGYFGIWNYFLHTGDTATVRSVFPKIKKYISLWSIQKNGLVAHRAGGWDWGDWGDDIDMPVLENAWYYLACKSYAAMANVLGNEAENKWATQNMTSIKNNFNKVFWTGTAYRSPEYKKLTDDRANAMAVLADMAEPCQYADIKDVFKKEFHASPYMEKYVIEALYKLGEEEYAQERLLKRFGPMINSKLTTLWEGWGIGKEGFGGGTYNHAWSGGGLTLLSQYVAGITPLAPGYKIVEIRPQMGKLTSATANISSVVGAIEVKHQWLTADHYVQQLVVPKTVALKIYIPQKKRKIKSVVINEQPVATNILKAIQKEQSLDLNGGKYKIVVKYE